MGIDTTSEHQEDTVGQHVDTDGTSAKPARPRKSPCASCPYRAGVPSGVWDASEYDKLPAYDGETFEQTRMSVFFCHQQDGCVCSGWLGHRDPSQLLAVRIGLMEHRIDPSCLDYTTDVELFGSGAQAAAHGKADLERPSDEARSTIRKILTKRD